MGMILGSGSGGGRRLHIPIGIVIGLIIAGVAVFKYYGNMQTNAVTGRPQSVSLTEQQEVALGLQAAPEMAAQFGGEVSDRKDRALVEEVGARLLASMPKEARNADGSLKYPFQYHVLADMKTVNAFALPGGQVFITEALLKRLETEGQLAGVLGHETGHVLGRHSAEQMSKAGLLQGLASAATVAASGSHDGGYSAQAISTMVANMMSLKYSREHELEADKLGLKFMAAAGYDPRSMIRVMEILEKASGGAGSDRPEFSSTHPNPGHRIEDINQHLKEMYPNGVPEGMVK